MPKDRLAELKAKHGGEDAEEMDNLMGYEKLPPAVGNSRNLQQSFTKLLRETEAVKESLQQVQDKITQMKSLQDKILSSPKNDPSVKQLLEKLVQSITKDMSNLGKDLKAINKTAAQEHKNRKISDTELRMIRTVHSSLTKTFQQVWEDMCVARSDYEGRCRKRIQRQMEIAGYTMTEEETDEAIANGVPIFSKDFVESESAKLALRDLQDRHDELLKLEKGIQEMHDMFVELNLMIENQGNLIDRIETCVVQATDSVTAGNDQLVEAKVKQQTARRRKWKCIAITTIICIIIAVIIALVIIYT